MFVKHPTSDHTGPMSIITDHGSRSVDMVDGVFEWPDELPMHNKFTEAAPPEQLAQAKRRRDLEELAAQAAKLGVKLEVPTDEPEADESPEEAERPISDMSLSELKAYAKGHGIELPKLKKADSDETKRTQVLDAISESLIESAE
ncbi:MAG: hypothetical protein KGL39_16605 [Patescibacteria group bacterium]|nr:hypothetical protein [Patescibacteria group bacterium]